ERAGVPHARRPRDSALGEGLPGGHAMTCAEGQVLALVDMFDDVPEREREEVMRLARVRAYGRGRGRRRLARRRQRGRERAERIRVVREAHAAGLTWPADEWRALVGWADIFAGESPRRYG